MQFFLTTAKLSYDQKCSPFGDHMNVSHNLQLLGLAQRLRYVHHSQAKPILATHLATALLHCSTSHMSTVLFMATALY